jgi:hypothetical protein
MLPVSRIRPTDVLIKLPAVRKIMGDIAASTVYEDPDLMGLKINLTAAEGATRAVNWIEREVHELRAKRVARSEERSATVREQIEKRRERRRAKQRASAAAESTATT